MRAVTLEDFSHRISKALLMVTVAMFLLLAAIAVLNFKDHLESDKRVARIELQDALELLTSELYGQIGILVSSSEFIDYMRSDLINRRKNEHLVRNLLSRISWSGISGISIYDHIGRFLFTTQNLDNLNLVNIPICYLGDTFDVEFGDCVGSIYIYLSNEIIIDRLQQINPKIEICSSCEPVKKLPALSGIIETRNSALNLPIEIPVKPDYELLKSSIAGIFAICAIIYVVLLTQIRSAVEAFIWRPLTGTGTGTGTEPIVWTRSLKEIQESHYRERLLSDLTKETADRERLLADNIHDIFLSDLATLKMLVWECDGSPDGKQRVNAVIDVAIKKARNIIDALRPETLDTLGLEKSLIILFDSLPLSVNRHFSGCLSSIPSGIDLQVYLIIKEALTNVIKHAEIDWASVTIDVKESSENYTLFIEIKDTGKGFDVRTVKAGIGLGSIKGRALSLGSHELVSEVGKGTSIQVFLNFEGDESHGVNKNPHR